MSTQITIDGTVYNLPSQGDNPVWGTDLSDIITALVEVASSTTAPGDILPTTASIVNGAGSNTAVAGLIFDPASVRGTTVSYSLDRSTSTTELSERGTLWITFNSSANSWTYSSISNGDAGVVFDVINGQVVYTSSTLSGSNYSGTISFKASTSSQ